VLSKKPVDSGLFGIQLGYSQKSLLLYPGGAAEITFPFGQGSVAQYRVDGRLQVTREVPDEQMDEE